jgi:hypothetical protein
LKHKRKLHSCGRIKKKRQSREFSIIVAGGYEGSYLSSVEILDTGSNEWREGPKLPFRIDKAEMEKDQNGVVVLVGGESDSDKYLDFFNFSMQERMQFGLSWNRSSIQEGGGIWLFWSLTTLLIAPHKEIN